MSEKVFLNDYEIEADIRDIRDKKNQPTGNIIKQIDLECNITGEDQYKTIGDILKDSFVLKIPSKNIEVKARASSHMTSYTGNLDDTTPVSCKINIDELDKDLPEKWDYKLGYGVEIVNNYARVIALINTLIQKGIINKEELNNKYKEIIEKDSRKLIEQMCYGKIEKKE